ncbi:hypothetical protein AVEN_250754-1 [Araneus ventricosus]|uniref:Uncharacterized protein n=1 Tax=Araneus ventricosus TaxID=182803 RepID=A0A4Y2DZ67_ARAVE|nr:hypothetical protein AVEN_250754-1 [Araneus ventricosus]
MAAIPTANTCHKLFDGSNEKPTAHGEKIYAQHLLPVAAACSEASEESYGDRQIELFSSYEAEQNFYQRNLKIMADQQRERIA